jgi:large subunit ribosomal protein L23
MKSINRILVEPHLTEKTSEFLLDEKAGIYKYAFKVAVDANKVEIKNAIEARFNVKVESVNTVVVKGKEKRVRTAAGFRPNWKKAYVKLQSGNRIAEFEGV